MKTTVSLPDRLVDAADEIGRYLGLDRSSLYARAIAEYVERHRDRAVTEALDAVYATETAEVDPVLDRMQREALPDERW